jgi:uncharacterized membrane protein
MFIVLSILGCVIGRYIFGIPHGLLGVVVSVPLAVGFVITRIGTSFIPQPPPRESDSSQRPDRIDLFLIAMLVVCLLLAIIFLVSSIPYLLIGLPGFAIGSLELFAGLLAAAVVLFVAENLKILSRTVPLVQVLRIIVLLSAEVFWNAIGLETFLSRRGLARSM